MKRLIFKWVLTWSKCEKKARICRLTYALQKKQFTFGLHPRLCGFSRQAQGWKFWFLGIVTHWHRAGGGYFPD